MRLKKAISFFTVLALLVVLPVFQPSAAGGPSLSDDQQWVTGLGSSYEYITERTYTAQSASAANNPYWTSLSGVGVRPDGTKYAAPELIEGNKLQVASAWYGQDVYFRVKGTAGPGTVIKVPEYSQLKEQYKKCIKVINVYSLDTGDSFYDHFITSITNNSGYLQSTDVSANIHVATVPIQNFNKAPNSYLTDAEGNYIYDLVAVGAYTDAEPDLSGAAAWALRRYIQEGYGFLIGHDTMYGYGGVNADPNYTPDPASTATPVYQLDTNHNGHWNMNWLMGVNKLYTEASPYEAASLILNLGDWHDKSTLYGDGTATTSLLTIRAVTAGDPLTDVNARCPTNYPYASFADGSNFSVGGTFKAGTTHTNQQIAYGKVWIDFSTNSIGGKLVTDRNEGLTGTNNFYLTTNGNFGLMQIGHSKGNLNGAWPDECRILANTLLYLSQRQPCEICQSEQGGNAEVHAVTRIASADDLAKIGNPDDWFTFPLEGCYTLTADITLPDDWQPISGFCGHFNADGHSITLGANGKPVFAQAGLLGANPGGWNLGTDPAHGNPSISNLMGKTTGVARVMGHLNQLFGTGSAEDYGGYTVAVTDADGKEYRVKTNREGKYVLANLPCTGGQLVAHVYDRTGSEVTSYGGIYAQVAPSAWDDCETVPLHLQADAVRPVPNQTIYEDSDAVFVGGFNSSVLPQKVTWQYRFGAGDDWRNVADTVDFDAEVQAAQLVDAQSPYVETRLTIKNAQITLDKMQFRAVFVVGGNTYNTFDAKTANAAGLLRVQERPYTLTPVQDVAGWEGDTLDLTTRLTYYRALGKEITVRWQYRGGEGYSWENVEGSPIVPDTTVYNSATAGAGADADFVNQSTLRIRAATVDISGYQFRAVFEYKAKSRRFETDQKSVPGATGTVTITPRLLQCSVQPQNSPLLLVSGSTIPGKVTYTAEFTYTAPTADGVALSWEYKTNAQDTYKPVSSFPYTGVAAVTTGSPVAKGGNTYAVQTTLTLTNPPAALDKDSNHFYFRAVAASFAAVAYSNSADITTTYKVDVQPGKPVAHVSADGKTKIYTYPNLQVTAPEGVRNMEVSLAAASRTGGNRVVSPAALASTTALPGQAGFVYNSSTALSAKAARDYLRQVQFVVATDTASVQWSVASDRAAGQVDPYSGNYYEYVQSPGITFATAFNAARSRYNTALQASGRLATVKSAAQNTLVHQLVGNQYAWLGLTSNLAYTYGRSGWGWIDGSALGYHQLQETSYPYVQMRPDGLWRTALNTQSATVTFTDMIQYNGSGLGGWSLRQGRLFATTPEGSDNRNGYTGICLLAPGSAGVDSIVAHSIYLQANHAYWVYGMIGEYGDSNGNMILSTPFGGVTSYWNVGPSIINTYWRFGSTGWQTIIAQTNGNGPNYTGVGGQLYHLEVVDLTESFENRGLSLPSVQWMVDNAGVFSGSRSVAFTSSSSNANGYVVEYVVNDNRPMHTDRSARAKDTLAGPKPGDLPTDTVKEAEYRTNTDVLLSCGVTALSPIHPGSTASVSFKVTAPDGSVTTQTTTDICLPAGATQRAYIQYHMPAEPGALKVEITTSDNLLTDTVQINGTVVELKENTPPDPKANDRNDSFVVPVTPSFADETQHTWVTYTCDDSTGEWVYTEHEHHEVLRAVLSAQPDEHVPTAEGKDMKSGYGINLTVTARAAQNDGVLMPQTVVAYFPEFRYKDYWRLLEPISGGAATTAGYQLKENPWSQANARVHFTPLWYPDGPYKVYVTVRDMWTPVGELKQATTDTITINGSVHDDWYVAKAE